jgi:hypothetical protein
MATGQHSDLWRNLRHGASILGIVALTVLGMRMFGPRPTAAQPAQQGDIRATSFTLVGPDGTVLARLAPGGQGNGNLTVFDTAGRPRAALVGSGQAVVYDIDGNRRVYLAVDATGDTAGAGFLISRDANGMIRTSVGADVDGAPFVRLFDENGPAANPLNAPCHARATLHQREDASFRLDVCDAGGNTIYTAP